MTRKELKMAAKSSLKGRLFVALLPILVMFGIGVILGTIQFLIRQFGGVGLVMIWGLVSIAISLFMIPLQVGYSTYYLKMANGEKPEINDMFWSYKKTACMVEQIKAYVLTGIIIFVGFLLFIIPGIIWALKYSQLGFAFAENPELRYDEAMSRSADLMKNRKGEYFVLGLSFILWGILAALTFGLLYIYLAPYMILTFATYYIDISGMNDEAGSDNVKKDSGDGLFEDGPVKSAEGNSESAETVDPATETIAPEKTEKPDDDIFLS